MRGEFMYSIIYHVWTHGYLLIFYVLWAMMQYYVICYCRPFVPTWPLGICVLWTYCHHCFIFVYFLISGTSGCCGLTCCVSKKKLKIVLEIRWWAQRVQSAFFLLYFICMGWIIFCWTLLEKWLLILSPSEGAHEASAYWISVSAFLVFFFLILTIISGYSWGSFISFSILKRARTGVIPCGY